MPSECVWRSDLKLFEVLHARGKMISNGGYGIHLPDGGNNNRDANAEDDHDNNHDDNNNNQCDKCSAIQSIPKDANDGNEHNDNEQNRTNSTNDNNKTQSTADVDNTPGEEGWDKPTAVVANNNKAIPKLFLFLEECLVLYEQGVVQVKKRVSETKEQQQGDTQQDRLLVTMQSSELYALLGDTTGVSLPVYLTYKHLKSQGYRVVRYNPKRRELLRQQLRLEQEKTRPETDNNDDTPTAAPICEPPKRWKLALRQVTAETPPPQMYTGSPSPPALAWDVYLPNARFQKTNPGIPDLCVAIMSYQLPSPPFFQLQQLLHRGDDEHVPLKIATVADSGTVVMFALEAFGVPKIQEKTEGGGGGETNQEKEMQS